MIQGVFYVNNSISWISCTCFSRADLIGQTSWKTWLAKNTNTHPVINALTCFENALVTDWQSEKTRKPFWVESWCVYMCLGNIKCHMWSHLQSTIIRWIITNVLLTLVSFQNQMTSFILWNTKRSFDECSHYFFHLLKVIRNRNCWISKMHKNTMKVVCSACAQHSKTSKITRYRIPAGLKNQFYRI